MRVENGKDEEGKEAARVTVGVFAVGERNSTRWLGVVTVVLLAVSWLCEGVVALGLRGLLGRFAEMLADSRGGRLRLGEEKGRPRVVEVEDMVGVGGMGGGVGILVVWMVLVVWVVVWGYGRGTFD